MDYADRQHIYKSRVSADADYKNTVFERHHGIRRLIFEARSLANHKSTRRLTSIILHIIDIYYHTLFIHVQSYLGSIFLST